MKIRILFVILCFSLNACIGYKTPTDKVLSDLKSTSKSFENVKIPDDWIFVRTKEDNQKEFPFSYDWIKELEDNSVLGLIDEGIRYNADINIAKEKLYQVQQNMGIASKNLLPSVDVVGGSQRFSNKNSLNKIELMASYEIDLWGKNRSNSEASKREFYSAEYLNTKLKQTISALIMKNYYLAIAGNIQLTKLQEYKLNTEELNRIVTLRQNIGTANELDVSNVRAELIQLSAQIEQLTNASLKTKRALELLTGRYPKGDLMVTNQFPKLKSNIPDTIPFRLLENRPDVLAVQFQIEKAFFELGSAEAARLPSIGLSASYGAASSNNDYINSLFSNPFAVIGGGLLAPIFYNGALKKNVAIKNSQQRQSVEEYSKVVLNSMNEVETALGSIHSLQIQNDYSNQAIEELKKNIKLTEAQISVGTSNSYALLQKQRDLIRNEMSVVDIQLQSVIERINLFMALGAASH